MKKTEVLDRYFVWICRLLGVEQETRAYWDMFKVMHNKKFISYIPNDDNREVEGAELRHAFCDVMNIHFHPSFFNKDISVLEVIMALAYRCERIMADKEGMPRMYMKDWFWHFMKNIKLIGCSDDVNTDQNFLAYIETIIDKFVNRTYNRNGEGGLFPLKFDKKDQRKIELWYQMSSYLNENYYNDALKV